MAGERFDLIATNPPFVISPATGERLVYRDSGLPGDRVVEHIVRTGPDHLNDGGWCRSSPTGRSSTAGRGTSGSGRGCATTATRWSCSARRSTRRRTSSCGSRTRPPRASRLRPALRHLAVWLEETGIEGVGFGWISVRLGGGGRHDLLEWPYDVEQPIGPAIQSGAEAATALRGLTDDELLRSVLRAREDVQQETVGRPGAEDPEAIVLRQQRGFRRARTADTVEAALVGASDGDLSLGRCSGRSPRCCSATRPTSGVRMRGSVRRARRGRLPSAG